MTYNEFGTLGNSKAEHFFTEIVAEQDMNNTWAKHIEKGKTKNAKDHAKKPLAFVTKAKEGHVRERSIDMEENSDCSGQRRMR